MSGRRTVAAGLAVAGLAVAGLVVSGCGAGPHRRSRAGAEPAVAPVVSRAPAGRAVRVGAQAEGIAVAPRPGLVAVAVRDPSRIVVLDARTGRVVRRVAIAGPARHLALVGAAGSRPMLLVPEAPIDRLLELPLARRGGRDQTVAVGSLPHDATAVGGRVFVADEFGRAVSVVAGRRQLARISGFTQPGGVAAVGKDVAVVDVGADMVSLIDASTLRVIGRARAGAGPTHVVAGPAGRLYVVDTRGDALLVYTTAPRLSLVHRTALPGTPYGIASDPARDRVWVTETATNRVTEFDVSEAVPRAVGAYPTGRQPNTIAVDSGTGRVFVADAAAGTVQFFDPLQAGGLR